MIERLEKNLAIVKNVGIRGWVYGIWHMNHNCEMPCNLSRFLRKKSGKTQIRLETYDGSNQCVHPDIIEYKDNIYITYTPYPFAIDIYENPQIAVYDKLKRAWISNGVGVITKPDDSKRMHYSDTFFYIHNGKLALFYRLTDKENDSRSTLYYAYVDNIFDEKRLTDYYDNEYISPFILEYKGEFLFHIERSSPNILYCRKISSFDSPIDDSVPKEKVDMIGFDENEWIWHLGASSLEELNTKSSKKGEFLGVATCINNGDYSFYYNCLCKLSCHNGKWTIQKINRIDEKQKKCKYSYKSCLCAIDGEKKIYISVIDFKHRHGIYELLLNEVMDIE